MPCQHLSNHQTRSKEDGRRRRAARRAGDANAAARRKRETRAQTAGTWRAALVLVALRFCDRRAGQVNKWEGGGNALVCSPPGSDFRDLRGDVEPGAEVEVDVAPGAPRFDFRGALFRAHSGSRSFASSMESTRGSEARGGGCLLGCTSRLRGGGLGRWGIGAPSASPRLPVR